MDRNRKGARRSSSRSMKRSQDKTLQEGEKEKAGTLDKSQ